MTIAKYVLLTSLTILNISYGSFGVMAISESREKIPQIQEMPQIPFEVYDGVYDKTVHVVSSCEKNNKTIIVYFDSSTASIEMIVKVLVNKAFDSPGITRIAVCRTRENTK